jgi:hypothetical protein
LVAFHEEVQNVGCERRVEIRETGVVTAKVGGFLVLSASAERLTALFRVQAIFYVDSLDEFVPWLRKSSAELLDGPRTATGGRNATFRHRDGWVVEYFEAKPTTGAIDHRVGRPTR